MPVRQRACGYYLELTEYFGLGFETESNAGFGFAAEAKAGFGISFGPKLQ